MNQELQQYILNMLKTGTNFASTQLPDIATQYLAFSAKVAVMFIVLNIASIFLGLILIFIGKNSYSWYILELVGGTLIFFMLVCIPFNVYNLIEVKTAPKVFLMEKVMEVVRK